MNTQHNITLKPNLNDCIVVLKSAAEWRAEHNILYSRVWDPKNISKELYLEEFYDFQAFVLYEDDIPIATATLADPSQKKQDIWDEILGNEYRCSDCLYVDDVGVIKEKVGQGILGELVNEIEKFALAGKYQSLRLDCDARLEKLVKTYKKYGFKIVCKKDMGYRISAFMEKLI